MESFYKKEDIEKLMLKNFKQSDSIVFDSDKIYVLKLKDYKNKTSSRMEILFECGIKSFIVGLQTWIKIDININNAIDLKLDPFNRKPDDLEG